MTADNMESVRTATSLSTFRQQLKTILYRRCFCYT